MNPMTHMNSMSHVNSMASVRSGTGAASQNANDLKNRTGLEKSAKPLMGSMMGSMMALILVAIAVAATSFIPHQSHAAAGTAGKKAKMKAGARGGADVVMGPGRPKLGTDFSFNASTIRGKYHYATEGMITVEDDKKLIDLLGVRQHFKDRLGDEKIRQ